MADCSLRPSLEYTPWCTQRVDRSWFWSQTNLMIRKTHPNKKIVFFSTYSRFPLFLYVYRWYLWLFICFQVVCHSKINQKCQKHQLVWTPNAPYQMRSPNRQAYHVMKFFDQFYNFNKKNVTFKHVRPCFAYFFVSLWNSYHIMKFFDQFYNFNKKNLTFKHVRPCFAYFFFIDSTKFILFFKCS